MKAGIVTHVMHADTTIQVGLKYCANCIYEYTYRYNFIMYRYPYNVLCELHLSLRELAAPAVVGTEEGSRAVHHHEGIPTGHREKESEDQHLRR